MKTKQTLTKTPFYKDMLDETQTISVNGKQMSKAIWNLIITKRDLSFWTKYNMKPTRAWKVSYVKKYFGIKGSGEVLMQEFMKIFNVFMGDTN